MSIRDMITTEDLEKFKELFRKQFNIELTDAEALEKTIALLTMMKHVYKPITQEEYDRVQQRRKETGDL